MASKKGEGLRDKPYLPLYVQDFLTDEKLIECSASATGVYIRIMCMMHKSEHYGKILLRQKDKQNTEQIKNFAWKVAKATPYDFDTILSGLTELVEEGVLQIEDDFLVQKRMVRDLEISLLRSESGKKGGNKTKAKNGFATPFATDFAQAKVQANSDNDIDNDIDDDSNSVTVIKGQPKNLNEPLNEIELAGTAEFVFRLTKREIASSDIESYWQAFLLASEGEFYPGRNKQVTHFRNWLKKEVTNGTFRSVGADQPQSRTEQYQRAYHDALAFINGGKELPGQSTRA